MTPQLFVTDIRRLLDDFLSGNARGSQCVQHIDALMADELPDGLSPAMLQTLHDFQGDLALYVEDAELREEDPAYYGADELRRKVSAFRERLPI